MMLILLSGARSTGAVSMGFRRLSPPLFSGFDHEGSVGGSGSGSSGWAVKLVVAGLAGCVEKWVVSTPGSRATVLAAETTT